jgi:hypothetical protein
MNSSLRQFYEERINDLISLKSENEELYAQRLDKFISLVLKDSQYISDLTSTVNEIKQASERISAYDKAAHEKVENMYGALQDSKMKTMLVNAAVSMYKYKYNNSVNSVCKFMFIQLEILVEYLEESHGLLAWAIEENKTIANERDKYQIGEVKYGRYKGDKYIQVGSKPLVANDFFSKKYGKKIISADTIKMIKEMRDYGSHGYHESKVASMNSTIGDVTANIDLYFSKWIEFLLVLKSYL